MNNTKVKKFNIELLIPIIAFVFPRRLKICGLYSNYLILIIGFILLLSKNKGKLKIMIGSKELPLFLYLISFVGIALVRLDFKKIFEYGIEFVLLTVYIINVVDSESKFKKILVYLRNVATVLSILGIIESLFKFNIFDYISGEPSVYTAVTMRFGLARCRTSFTMSINFAMFLVLCLLNDYYLLTLDDINKKYSKFFIIIHILGLIFTFSRMPILVAVLISFLFGIRCGTLKILKKLIPYFLGILFIYFTLVYIFGFTKIKNSFSNLWNLFYAVFSNEAAGNISSDVNNANGIGQRLQLYDWIWDDVKDSALIGLGWKTDFSKTLYQNRVWNKYWVKTSIENHYLYLLYHSGILGLSGFCIYILGGLNICFLKQKNKFKFENGISFKFLMLCCILSYSLMIFACGGFDDLRLIYIFITLGIIYDGNKNGG